MQNSFDYFWFVKRRSMKSEISSIYKQFILPNAVYLLPFFVLFFVACISYFLFGNIIIHQQINGFVGGWGDYFFKNITELGNGTIVFILVPFLFIKDINTAVRLLVAFALSTLVVWLFKFGIFTDAPRPLAVFNEAHIPIKTVAGIRTHLHNTFPSGHSTTVFTILSCVAFSCKTNRLKILCLLTAALIGFSRVYLSQHFLQDVACGALIGTICSLFAFSILRKKHFYWKTTKKYFIHQVNTN